MTGFLSPNTSSNPNNDEEEEEFSNNEEEVSDENVAGDAHGGGTVYDLFEGDDCDDKEIEVIFPDSFGGKRAENAVTIHCGNDAAGGQGVGRDGGGAVVEVMVMVMVVVVLLLVEVEVSSWPSRRQTTLLPPKIQNRRRRDKVHIRIYHSLFPKLPT